jgi:hypothetical protein
MCINTLHKGDSDDDDDDNNNNNRMMVMNSYFQGQFKREFDFLVETVSVFLKSDVGETQT